MNFSKKLLTFVFALIVGLNLFAFVIPATVLAQAPSQDQGLVPCGSFSDNPCQLIDLFRLVIVITNFLIEMAGIVAVVVIIFAGYSLVVAAGNIEAVTEAKKLLVGAFIGFFFVLASMVLANFLIFGGREIIPGTHVIRGEKASITKCPIAYIMQNDTCGDLTTPGGGNSNTPANNAPNPNPAIPLLPKSSAPSDGDGVALVNDAPASPRMPCDTASLNSIWTTVTIVPTAYAQSCPIAKQYYTKIANDWPYLYRQDSYPIQYGTCPAGQGGTIAESGCGVVATAQVLNWIKGRGYGSLSSGASTYLNQVPSGLTVETLAETFVYNGYRVCNLGSKWDSPALLIPWFYSNYKGSYTAYSTGTGNAHLNKSQAKINEIISNTTAITQQPTGIAIAVVGGAAPWTMPGHFVTILGSETKDGFEYFKIADPYKKTDVVLIEKHVFAKVVKAMNYIYQPGIYQQ